MLQFSVYLTNMIEYVSYVMTALSKFTLQSVIFRLLLAVICGGLIGMERGRKRRPAGLRTYIIVCLGAALTMLLGQYEATMLANQWSELLNGINLQTDVSRFSAQVINGVGFIGAGTVLTTSKQETKGLTTAACLWASACMGIAIGAGFYEGVLLGFFVIFIVVRVFPYVEIALHNRTKNMNIYLEIKSLESLGKIISCLKKQDATIFDMDISKSDYTANYSYGIMFSIRMKSIKDRIPIMSMLSEMEQILTVEEEKLGAL